jgi:hypothetical protein
VNEEKYPMKTRIALVVLILVVGIALVVKAQEAEQISDTAKGYFVQVVNTAELVENSDGTYTLTISELPSFVTSIIDDSDSGLGSGNYAIGQFLSDFKNSSIADAPSLNIPARLQLENAVLDLILSNPSFDASDLSNVAFTVTVENAINLENGKKLGTLPSDISNASLIFQADNALLKTFADNRLANIGRISGSSPTCTMKCP